MEYHTTPETVIRLVSHVAAEREVDGFTLTGGEPFWQPEALAVLLPLFSQISKDILIYTGYVFEEVQSNWPELASQASAIVDGPYVEERNTGLPLRGSNNQRLILREDWRETYEKWVSHAENSGKSLVQNFTTQDGVISVGIHRPGYGAAMDRMLRQRGWIADRKGEPR